MGKVIIRRLHMHDGTSEDQFWTGRPRWASEYEEARIIDDKDAEEKVAEMRAAFDNKPIGRIAAEVIKKVEFFAAPLKMDREHIQKAIKDPPKKIVFAAKQQVEYLEPFVNEVLDAFEEVLNIKGAWVSDLSTIYDFLPRDKAEHAGVLKKLSEVLNVPVTSRDKIHEVALAIKKSRE